MSYNDGKIALFTAQAADGSSASTIEWPGGEGVFAASGTFGSGTCKLQWSADYPSAAATWLDVDRSGDTFVTFTANGSGAFDLPHCWIRANLAGSTAPSLNATVLNVEV